MCHLREKASQLESSRPADSLEFEEEPWEETNDAEQEQWWNSWVEEVEQERNEAHLGAPMVGGTEFELNSFKTASGEILPDEGQLMWLCFLQDGRKCWLRGHVTDVHKPLISAGKVLGADKVGLSCIPVEVRSSLGTHPPET